MKIKKQTVTQSNATQRPLINNIDRVDIAIIKTARSYPDNGKIQVDYRLIEEYRIAGKDRHRFSTGMKSTPQNRQRVSREVFSFAFNHYLQYVKQKDTCEITLGDIAMEAIREDQSNRTSDTQNDYESIYTRTIEPIFKDTPIVDIRIKDVSKWMRDLLENTPVSKSRFSKLKRVLNFIFDYAMREEIIDKNPVSLLKNNGNFKATSDKSKSYFTKEEVQLMLDNTEGFFNAYLTTLFFTGMRIGELLALQWDDINFEKSTILIQRSTRHGEIKSTKTNITNEIVMSKPLKETLLKYKEIVPQSEWIFPNPETNYVYWESGAIVKRYFKPLLKKLNIPYRPIRHGRATFASLMVENGISLTKIQQYLGHSNLQTTLNYYTKNGLLKLESDDRIDNLYAS